MSMAGASAARAGSDGPVSPGTGDVYEIRIKEVLDQHWQQWFEGMALSLDQAGDAGLGGTLITGEIMDQPALHSLLDRILDLNLTLVSVRRLPAMWPNRWGEDQIAREGGTEPVEAGKTVA